MNLLEKARKDYRHSKEILVEKERAKQLERKKLLNEARQFFIDSIRETVAEATLRVLPNAFYHLGTEEEPFAFPGLTTTETRDVLVDTLREEGFDFCSQRGKIEDHILLGFMISGWAEK